VNPTAWRLLPDETHHGARHMALDVAALGEAAEPQGRASLRLYVWRPPCLSLGRHQPAEAADLEFCRRAEIDVIRRPTGGRALLHQLELTYSVVAPLGVAPLPSAVQDAYRTLCGVLVEACHALGVAAELSPGEVNLSLPGPRTTVPCFRTPAGGEVVVAGRKLIGSAMRVHRGHILQHGAILLDWDSYLQAGAMGLPDDTTLRPHITTLSAELGAAPPVERVKQALLSAFESTLGLTLEPATWSPAELRRARELEPSFVVQTARSGHQWS